MHDLTDPVSGQPAFKNAACAIAPVAPEWRAFLVSRDPIVPACLYWARARIEGGWLFELAGEGSFGADALLPAGPRCDVSDRQRGMLRITVPHVDGGLAAALYLTRSGRLPDRDWIVRQFASADASGVELLAGRPSTPLPDRGEIVCVCMDVGENEILAAAREGACSIVQIGDATRAGTNCGSCRPIIARLADAVHQVQAEAAQ